MASIRINKSLNFRPVLPGYEEKSSFLRWMTESKEDSDLSKGLFDKLISSILAHSTNAKIVDNEVDRAELQRKTTELFIKHGNPPEGKLSSDFMPMNDNTIVIQADKIVITQAMLDDTHCAMSLSGFAQLRDTNDSYLVHIDKEKIIIDSIPSSEENSEFERWNCSNNLDMQAIVRRKKHFKDLREGTVKPVEDKQIFTTLPALITEDNSLNRAGKLREWLKRESAFLSSITKR